MSLTLSADVLAATTTESLRAVRESAAKYRSDREHLVPIDRLSVADLQDVIKAANSEGDRKVARAVEAILRARDGRFDKPIPNFKAFQNVLEAYLKSDVIDGWIYVTRADGRIYPELVTSVVYDNGRTGMNRSETDRVIIVTMGYGLGTDGNYKNRIGIHAYKHSFDPQDVANRRMPDILAAKGIFKETTALRDDYLHSIERYRATIRDAFTEQFRFTGSPVAFESHIRRGEVMDGRRVIHDIGPQDRGPMQEHAESVLFEGDPDAHGYGAIPEHPVVRLFDLRVHEFFWGHADNLTPYEYDTSLRDKLILPASHRDLLDVLTSDLDAFVSDIIEGKSAGNVILCKGIPGVGKTLTAEVYAELIRRPLYSIRSGALGTSAAEIDKNLREIFQRGKRWNAVLLLDEADVFVVERGSNIEQNAIVAEFLRTLEYFDGLLFMTTNRPHDIDEAIISRCAAIINYDPPNREDAKAIWVVMARQYGAELDVGLLDQLLDLFPDIAPRDIKMLFRLALRVSKSRGETLDLELFRRCAMFRAIKIKT
jgi:hypothetical protein